MAFTPPSSLAPVSVTVAGAVSVTNFPAVQPVSGTVAVSNFPASQAVTVASLPLPAGAATEATLDDALAALNDVALTAILERDKITQ
jgi:hypothetical protein